MKLLPNAKINLGLNILFKRTDGFHELETGMIPIPLCDELNIELDSENSNGSVSFTSSGLVIDGAADDNLVCKAYKLLHANFNLPAVKVHLNKIIPFGAGLGGGSADAAFMLKGLNQLFNLNLSTVQLEEYAAELGSDCAFFIKNQPAISRGRGELLEDYPLNLSDYTLALIVPPVHISTAVAYSKVTPNKETTPVSQILNLPVEEWTKKLKNDFEPSVFAHAPAIEEVKDQLYEAGAIYASLSGSGSSVFGIFKNKTPDFSNMEGFTFICKLE